MGKVFKSDQLKGTLGGRMRDAANAGDLESGAQMLRDAQGKITKKALDRICKE